MLVQIPELETLTLSDGRVLGWSEFGDPYGVPVIHNHGGLSCRLEAVWLDEAAKDAGVRLIAPDRPGIASSGPKSGRSVMDWAEDVRVLAGRLGIEQMRVTGWSFGGPYALALSARLGDWVEKIAVIGSAIPLDDADAFRELNAMDRHFMNLSREHPEVATAAFEAMGIMARSAPHAYNAMAARSFPRSDADAMLALPEPGFALAIGPCMGQPSGVTQEYLTMGAPWGFVLEQVAAPVEVWHGEADALCPRHWSEELAHKLNKASLHMVPGRGHLLPLTNAAQIFASIAG